VKVKDLISELSRFDGDSHVAVDVSISNCIALDGTGDDSVLMTVEKVIPENGRRVSVSLELGGLA